MKAILLLLFITVSALLSAEYTITAQSPFDPSKLDSYQQCEHNATKIIQAKAIEQYIGCQSDSKRYDIELLELKQGKRSLTTDSCSIEATYSVQSKYLEAHEYLLGQDGAICSEYDTTLIEDGAFWNTLEVGIFAGLSNTQENLELLSSDSKINYYYTNVPLYGLSAAYAIKIFNAQYIGTKIYTAVSTETYESTGTTTSLGRNDGNPSILRFGAGAYYAYRYHLKTELALGLNYYYDTITRTYSNNTYTGEASTVNAELTLGYYLYPSFKLWVSGASDLSANTGFSVVF